MRLQCAVAMMVIAFAITVKGQAAPDAAEITKLLNDFLAATNDPAMHERFWAEDLSGGDLKYSRLESGKETINVYGNTAVLRGESLRQRSSIPATPGKGDAQPFTAFYTITFVNQTGAWKAVAMHTSRGDK